MKIWLPCIALLLCVSISVWRGLAVGEVQASAVRSPSTEKASGGPSSEAAEAPSQELADTVSATDSAETDAIEVIRASGREFEWSGRNPAASRARYVEINPALLRVADNAIEAGDRLELELFDGERFHAQVTRRQRWGRQDAIFTATARSRDDSGSFMVLSSTGGIVKMAVVDARSGRDYQVRYDVDSGEHVLLEIDHPKSESYGCANEEHAHADHLHLPEGLAPEETAHPSSDATRANDDEDSVVEPVILDVMIVYTPAALAAEGGRAAIEATMGQAVAIANLVHENSRTLVRLNLVHSHQVDYAETGDAYDDLAAVEDIDGVIDEVHELRNLHGADFVSFFISTDQVGGLGNRPRNYDSPDEAFSLVRVQQSDSTFSYTTAHEIAHNMGVGHSKTQYAQEYNGIGVAGYAAGWQWPDSSVGSLYSIGYCSIMTYVNFDGQDNGYEYKRVPHFSNPEVRYNGSATGDSVDGDAARAIRDGREIFANFRVGVRYPLFDAFPYEYGFEPGEQLWFQSGTDDGDWTMDHIGTTPSFGTGPGSARAGNRYAYLEATGNYGDVGSIAAEFDFSRLIQPEISFFYHMYDLDGGDMGTLRLQASADGGLSWQTLFVIDGNQGDQWREARISLQAYAGERVLLRFQGEIGRSYQSDIALDDIWIDESPSGDAVAAFLQWVSEYPGLSDQTMGGDPDGDGLGNFLEYAFGSNPDSFDSAAHPSCAMDPLSNTMTYRFVRARANLEYRLESVPAMHLWENPDIEWTSANPTSGNPLVQVGGEQAVTVDASAPQLFLRLEVKAGP